MDDFLIINLSCILHYYFIYYINTWEISNMRLKRPISSSGQVKHMEILTFYSFSLGVVVKSEWIPFPFGDGTYMNSWKYS
jgi:hypothetical protein